MRYSLSRYYVLIPFGFCCLCYRCARIVGRMSISSTSTFAEVVAEFEDNIGYDIEGDVASCKLFIKAARVLLRRINEQVGQSDNSLQYDSAKIQQMLDAALAWWRANDSSATGVQPQRVYKHVSFEGFRD